MLLHPVQGSAHQLSPKVVAPHSWGGASSAGGGAGRGVVGGGDVNGGGFMQPAAGVSQSGGAGAGAIPRDAPMMGAPIMNAGTQGGPMRQILSPPHSWQPGKAGEIVVPVEQLTPALSPC